MMQGQEKNPLKEQPTRKRSDDTILKEMNVHKERIIRLQDNYADGHIDTQTFQETSNRYQQQLQLLEKEKREISDNESTYQKYLKNGIDLLTDIKRFYNEGDYVVKHAILGSMFPGKLFFEKNNCRTTGLNEALRLILNTSKIQRKKKRTTLQ
jgi:site-specific DNA recombinase